MWLNPPADKCDLHPAVQETCPVSEKNFVAVRDAQLCRAFSRVDGYLFFERACEERHSHQLCRWYPASGTRHIRTSTNIANRIYPTHEVYLYSITVVPVFCVYYTYYICICHWCPCVYAKINMYTVCMYIYIYTYICIDDSYMHMYTQRKATLTCWLMKFRANSISPRACSQPFFPHARHCCK